jgi:hypothetical protein
MIEWRLIMANTLVRVYDNLGAAQNARNALLLSGFPPSRIDLRSNVDEAGPVEGNFVLDYENTEKGPLSDYSDSLFDSEVNAEGGMKPDVMERGNHVLTVDTSDEEELARASDITRKFGAREPVERPDRPRTQS